MHNYNFNILTIVLITFCVHKVAGDDDPDAHLPTPAIIARYGYPSEAHTVITEDGYILTLHRIPHSKYGANEVSPRQPVLLQHGLVASSSDFLTSGEKKSLAFILSRAGYDVWLGNARGNTYSQSHLRYTTNDMEFWDFSWDEMAQYDLPAVIDYIGNVTDQRGELLYVGHSMGTTMFFALMSSKPEYQKKIKAMFALAPVAYLSHVKSPVRFMAPWVNDIEWVYRVLGMGQFIPNVKILRFLAKFGCQKQTNIESICRNFIFVLTGFDADQFNKTLLPVILSHTPAATSVRTVVHFGQEIYAGKFQWFDFGKKKNLEKYGTSEPPQYDVTNITVPIAAFYAENDWLAGPQDVNTLCEKLPNKIAMYNVPNVQFNHVDFMWAIDAPKLVYHPLMDLMKRYRS